MTEIYPRTGTAGTWWCFSLPCVAGERSVLDLVSVAVKLCGVPMWYWTPHPMGVQIAVLEKRHAEVIADFVVAAANRELSSGPGLDADGDLKSVQNAGIF